MRTFVRTQLWPAIAILLALTVITGFLYPAIASSTIRGAFDRKRRHPLHRRPRSHEPTRRA